MIPSLDVRIAEYVVDQSGAVDILLDGRKRSQRGRKTNRDHYRLFLIGGLLCVMHHGCFVIDKMHKTLTEDLPLDDQFRIGVRRRHETRSGEETIAVLDVHAFYRVTRTFSEDLDYGEDAKDIDDDERDRRHEVVRSYCDALMDVFDFGWTTTTYAIDATGLWSWGRGRPSDAGAEPTGTDEPSDLPIDDDTGTHGDEELPLSA